MFLPAVACPVVLSSTTRLVPTLRTFSVLRLAMLRLLLPLLRKVVRLRVVRLRVVRVVRVVLRVVSLLCSVVARATRGLDRTRTTTLMNGMELHGRERTVGENVYSGWKLYQY